MKNIKNKAIEAQRNIHPLFESINDLTEEPVSVYDQEDMRNMFEQGANYVLEQIENYMKDLDLGNSAEEKFYKLDILADIGLFIEQLKK